MRIVQVTFLGFQLPIHDRKKRLVNPDAFNPYEVSDTGNHLNVKWRGWTATVEGPTVVLVKDDGSKRFEVPRAHCVVEYGPPLPVAQQTQSGQKPDGCGSESRQGEGKPTVDKNVPLPAKTVKK